MELDEYTDPTEYGDHEEHGEHDVTEYDEEEDMRSIEIKTCTLSLKRESYAYTNPDIRSKVASKLKSKYSDKNGEILEKHIHNATVNYCKRYGIPLKTSNSEYQMIYIGLAYDVLHSSESANEIAKNLKNGKVIWNSQRYQSLVEARTIEESDMTKDVAEGIYTCKCGSKKTQSIQIQTRSGDEGMTSFITCVMCKKMWKINN